MNACLRNAGTAIEMRREFFTRFPKENKKKMLFFLFSTARIERVYDVAHGN